MKIANSKVKAERLVRDALEKAAKDLSDRIMPIGAKMYQQASAEDSKKSDDKKDNKSDDKDDAVEGEVVDK